MSRRLLLLLMMVMMLAGVSALGITPGKNTIYYEAGEQVRREFSVINSDGEDMELVVISRGELDKYISLSDVSFSMSSGERERKLSYTLDIPRGLSPGPHTSEVVVMKLPKKSPSGEVFIGATVAVTTELYLFVPYPGKFIEAELNVVQEEDKVIFALPVMSRGDLDLVRVRASIDVYSSLNEKITSLSSNEIALASERGGELSARWDVSGERPGPYRAVATVFYDEDSLTIEREFDVGVKRLSLEGIQVNDFSLGEIAKFEIFIENKWNEEITDVYAQMLVYNSKGEVMADFKSPNYDVAPLEKTLMIAFWDTGGVREGTYDSRLFLRYGASSEERDLKLEISENNINIVGVGYVVSSSGVKGKSESSTLVMMLLIAVIVLILINLSWFLYFRKKLKK